MNWKPFDFFKYNPETDGNQTFNIEKALNENWDHTEELVTEIRGNVENIRQDLSVKPRKVSATLLSSRWNKSAKTYSFETEYPAEAYDISVEYAANCTKEQVEAWSAALLAGSITGNSLTAIGEVPTIDIPIYITVTPLALESGTETAGMLLFGDTDTGYYAQVDGKTKNVENIVGRDDDLTQNSYSLEIL